MLHAYRRRRHPLVDGADFRKFFYQVLDVAGDGGEDHVAEDHLEREPGKTVPFVVANTSCRWIHCHLELAHKINAQDRAINLTLDKIKTKTVRVRAS